MRIDEIQEATNPSDWYWVDGKLNISDWLTRGKSPRELGEDSPWQRDPDYLRLPENQWPVKQDGPISDLPEQIKPVMLTVAKEEETLSDRIDINCFSTDTKLLHVTARILPMYKPHPQYSFANAARNLTPQNLEETERLWITDAQKSMKCQLEREETSIDCALLKNQMKLLKLEVEQKDAFKLATITKSWFCFLTIIDFPGYLQNMYIMRHI